jgi:hypothetical protein
LVGFESLVEYPDDALRHIRFQMEPCLDCHPCVAQIRQLNPNIPAVIGDANIQYTRLNEASPR